MKVFLALLLFLLTFQTKAQQSEAIKSENTKLISDSVRDVFVNRFLFPDEELSLNNKPARNYYKKNCIKKGEYFKWMANNKLLITNDSLNKTINSIIDNLAQHNSSIPSEYFTILLYRDIIPNASSFDEGLILLNLGLIQRCQTIDELAFIIAHEMSHDLKNHYYKSSEMLANIAGDRDLSKKIKKANKNKGILEQSILEIRTSITKELRTNDRKEELEADSLGFVLFTNAGYNPAAAIKSMLMLDKADYFFHTDTIHLSQTFNFNNYPFNPDWLIGDDLMPLWKRQEEHFEIPLEQKTHPTAKTRIKVFKSLNQTYTSSDYILFTQADIVAFEIIESLLINEQYSLAIHEALQLLKSFPNSIVLHSAISQSFMGISFALKNHNFSEVVDMPNEAYPVSYNQVLTFLHSLSSKKLKEIAKTYHNIYAAPNQNKIYQDFASIVFTNEAKQKTKEQNNLIDLFTKKYPNTSKSDFLTKYLTYEH